MVQWPSYLQATCRLPRCFLQRAESRLGLNIQRLSVKRSLRVMDSGIGDRGLGVRGSGIGDRGSEVRGSGIKSARGPDFKFQELGDIGCRVLNSNLRLEMIIPY